MRSRLLSCLALLLVILAAGCDFDVGRPRTTAPPPTTHVVGTGTTPAPFAYDIRDDLQYMDTMVPHHQLAIDMAKIALKRASHGEINGLSMDIIIQQQDEIRRMLLWRSTFYPDAPTPLPGNAALPPHMPGMDVDLKALEASRDFDRDFINAMLPHHETAIEMSQAAMPNLKHLEVRDFAHDVITVQQLEIDRMLLWRQEWFK